MINLKGDERPQRYGWAPGDYLCKCSGEGCKAKEDKTFIGDKRAIICSDCAYTMPAPQPFEEIMRAQVTELLRHTRKLELEIEEWVKQKGGSST